ncbi:histidinol-phosphate transaminase [uncultured Croceitalea sp.]|uniref:pyridoxal phosphate-dependent aminotransferase n=1 Tax=uncultured Croceitalea sp. TaxID=1798908 RepID=UPI003305A295
METRRDYLKKMGLGALALNIAPVYSYANESIACQKPADARKIYLNANENPYGPSPLARKAMVESVTKSNRYGWSQKPELIAAVAAYNKVSAENIMLGSGSTEILNLVLQYAAQQKGNIVTADNTFNFWMSPAKTLGLEKINVPLTANKENDLTALKSAITAETKLVYLCNPNNPTGTLCKREELIAFVQEVSKNTLVLLDEAYIDLTDQESLSSLVSKKQNLIIAKTFSKLFGLAGARIGYAVAHGNTVKKLSSLQSWTNGAISVVSTAGALASLKDVNFIEKTFRLNVEARAYTIKEFEKLNIRCIPSNTNFIYFSLANYTGQFFEQLKKHNIVGTRIYEKEGKWSRITVGKLEDMKVLINALS